MQKIGVNHQGTDELAPEEWPLSRTQARFASLKCFCNFGTIEGPCSRNNLVSEEFLLFYIKMDISVAYASTNEIYE